MPHPVLCLHNEAVLHWHENVGLWERRCQCHLNAYGESIKEADSAFVHNVERMRIAHIRRKLAKGEKLRRAEEVAFSYSPYGTAASCHH